jgi:hypothetical protein
VNEGAEPRSFFKLRIELNFDIACMRGAASTHNPRPTSTKPERNNGVTAQEKDSAEMRATCINAAVIMDPISMDQ